MAGIISLLEQEMQASIQDIHKDSDSEITATMEYSLT
jgi:hypothetical protein